MSITKLRRKWQLPLICSAALLFAASCKEPVEADLPQKSSPEETGENVALNDMAIAAWHKGDYQTALEYIKKSVKKASEKGDETEMAFALNNQGLVSWSLGNADAALECYEEAAAIAQKRGMYTLLGLTHTNRGLVYKERNIYAKALEHNEKAIEIFSKHGDFRELAIALNNQGQIYKKQHKPAIAKGYYLKALDNYRKENYRDGMAATYYNLAEIGKQENNKTEALARINESIRLSKAANNQVQIKDAYKLLAEIYEHFSDKDSALKYYKIHTELNTKQLLANQSDKIAAYQAELGAEVKNLRIANLQKEQQLAKSRLWLVGILSGSALIVVLAVFYRYLLKIRYRKRGLEMELENSRNIIKVKEQELKDYILDLAEKNRTINKLQEQLYQFSPSPEDSGFQQLLEQKILTDDDWATFKQKFKNIYPMFFTRVKQSKVALTEAEIRIIMLLCLKLSGKEMAAMLGISSQSARVGKLRLKKKLQGEGYGDISEFIPLLAK